MSANYACFECLREKRPSLCQREVLQCVHLYMFWTVFHTEKNKIKKRTRAPFYEKKLPETTNLFYVT